MAGPSQAGWGAQQTAAVNTQIGQGVGQNYAKAAQSLNMGLAARGGGNEFLPNGAANTMKEQLAASGANEMSNQQLQATQANYAQGNKNWQEATGGLQALQGDYGAQALAGSAESSGNAAYSDAHQNAMQASQQFDAYASGFKDIATGISSFKPGK